MGADAALISSFGRLADAGKRDYSGQLRAQREHGDIISEGINKTAGIIAKGIQDRDDANREANEESRKRSNENLRRWSKGGEEYHASLESGGQVGDFLTQTVHDETARIKKDDFEPYNTGENTPENTKGRQDALNSQKRVIDDVVGLRTSITVVSQDFSKSGGTNISDANSEENVNFYGAVIDNYTNPTGLVGSHYEGKVLYVDVTTPGYVDASGAQITEDTVMSKKASDFGKDLITKNIKGEEKMLKTHNDAGLWGADKKNQNAEFDEGMEAYSIETYLLNDEDSSPAACADLFQRGGIPGQPEYKIEGNTGKWTVGSWAHSLQAHPSLNMAVYKAAGVKVDGILEGEEADGEVSQAEAKAVMNGENKDIVISTIVDPYYINPITGKNHYNHRDSIRGYAEFKANLNAQAAQKARESSDWYPKWLEDREGEGKDDVLTIKE